MPQWSVGSVRVSAIIVILRVAQIGFLFLAVFTCCVLEPEVSGSAGGEKRRIRDCGGRTDGGRDAGGGSRHADPHRGTGGAFCTYLQLYISTFLQSRRC